MIGVNVAVFRAGRVLLTMREDFEVWCLPGGTVDPGETLPQAAVREMREETGLEVQLQRLVGLYAREDWNKGYHIALFAGEITGGSEQPDPAEVLEIAWFDPAELPPMVLGHRQRVLDAAEERSGIVRCEAAVYPADLPAERPALYAARDAAQEALGLSRAEFYMRHFVEDGPGIIEVGE